MKDDNTTLISVLSIPSRNYQTFNVCLTYLVRVSIKDHINEVILKLYRKWWDDQYENVDPEFLPIKNPKTVKEALLAIEKFYGLKLELGDMIGLDTYDENLNRLCTDAISSNELPFSLPIDIKRMLLRNHSKTH